MKRYNLINNVTGWACFVIAALTYLLTVEPTASFWDCPEFVTQGAKLEVGHPPGNPIFMLAARFFITLFGGGMDTAALAVNCMSALLSAATILLLFWTVTHFTRRLIVADDATEVSPWKTLVIMAGGVCGALAYTWSDTFWFSAVEAEVYAFSSFCTALVVWLMLKWEARADKPHSDRYLVLIAYVIGVSIAVHLLNLLCIPALGLIFYYRKWRQTNVAGSLAALGVSCVIVGAILYGLVPGFVQVAQWFELMFVNGFGTSYNTGVFIYAIVLTAVYIMSIRTLYRARNPFAAKAWFWLAIALSGMPFIGHSITVGVLVLAALAVYLMVMRRIPVRIFTLIVLSIFVIFVGYSSYALLLIRSTANTPMNQNSPDNVFALASYLNREQYGDRPLFKGPVFAESYVEEEYPRGSGNYYIVMDDYGRPKTRIIDGYLRDENGSALNTPEKNYTKVVKKSPDEPDRYVQEVERPNYKTSPGIDMFFTRMYGGDAHLSGYKAWTGYRTPDINNIPQALREKWAEQGFAPSYEVLPYLTHLESVTTAVDSQTGEPVTETAVWKPDFGTNMRFFVNYQLNHMYWRYFMWNFAGRQNDIQGNGEPHLGNWISGIPVIDNARLGDQSALPDEFGKGNKGHNVFYMLPLILGLIGLLWQALWHHKLHAERGIQQFWVVFFLFFMTGIAIVLYLNQTPGQPRERDYAFAGSFYAFAIWIGMGVPAIAVMLKQLLAGKKAAVVAGAEGSAAEADAKAVAKVRTAEFISGAVAVVVALFVPLQMVSQTWDDHDRSGRYTTRDFGFNYLSSLDPDAIIFTNGDNDTFPLWYAQEVENFRPDVRVVNLSYLTTDWYANQMQHPTEGAAAVPMLARPENYAYETLAYNFVVPIDSEVPTALESLDELYKSDASRFGAHIMTHPKMVMPVDRDAALRHYATGNPVVDSLYIAPGITDINIDLSSNTGLNQSRILSLDMIANNVASGWQRPTYFATTVPSSYYLGLTPFLNSTGMAYEVTPFRDAVVSPTAEKAYRRIVSEYRWGGLDAPDAEKLYLDETVRRMVASVRSGMFTVAEDLFNSGELPVEALTVQVATENGMPAPANRYDLSRQLLDMIQEKLPTKVTPYDGMIGLYMARLYLNLYLATGDTSCLAEVEKIAGAEADRYAQLVKYATTLSAYDRSNLGTSETYGLQYLSEALSLLNYAELLQKSSGTAYADEARRLAEKSSLETDLRVAPLIFIDGYTADGLEEDLRQFPERQRGILQDVVDVLRLNEELDVDALQTANALMEKYNFSPQAWNSIL
ncbi:MAG: DUF2723 domain-containing protein [Muribaculaceae bacterium]|nr:DUF2723 domain-containing protein [Muribaculaceae bacterium]